MRASFWGLICLGFSTLFRSSNIEDFRVLALRLRASVSCLAVGLDLVLGIQIAQCEQSSVFSDFRAQCKNDLYTWIPGVGVRS